MERAMAAFAIFTVFLFIHSTVSVASNPGNPADELVEVINGNRSAHKSSVLVANPGLGCLALQYIKAYEGSCGDVGPNGKKPASSAFVDVFSPACGVQAPTLAPLTGRLLGCQTHYVLPSEAFSSILIRNSGGLDILYNKNHTQVGAAVSGTDGGSPYFWCVLFSAGAPNSTFVLDGGMPKTVRPGCFSGAHDDCSSATAPAPVLLLTILLATLFSSLTV
ncbi:ferredoxin-like protein [Wolffia australiana]